MSINQLQAIEFPKLGVDVVARKLSRFIKSSYRRNKLAIRRSRNRAVSYYRSQYYPSTAVAEFKTAVSKNEDIMVASVILALSLYFAFMNMTGEVLLLFFQTGYDIAELTGINMAVLLVIVCGILAVIGSWLAALLINMISFSIMDGANRKVYRSFRSTARKSLQYASRVSGAWIALIIVIMVPLIVVGVNSILLIKGALSPVVALEAILPFAATLAIASTVLLLINYGLVPFVALFEPDIPLHKALDRSYQLVRRRGRIFLMSIYGAFGLSVLAAYGLALGLNYLLKIPTALTVIVLFGLIALSFNSILVIFYRKRKQSRIK